MITGWLEKFLVSLVLAVLQWIAKRAQEQALEHEAQVIQDKIDQVRDDDNVKKYHDAKDRAEKIEAALDLVNRTSSH